MKSKYMDLLYCAVGGLLLYGLTLGQLWMLHAAYWPYGAYVLTVLGMVIGCFAVLYRKHTFGGALLSLCGLTLFWLFFAVAFGALGLVQRLEAAMGLQFGNGEGMVIVLFAYAILGAAVLAMAAAALWRRIRKR